MTITVNGTAIDNGDSVEWEDGENTVVVKVDDAKNPGFSTTYTVTMTYSSSP